MRDHPLIWGVDVSTQSIGFAIVGANIDHCFSVPIPQKDRGARRLARGYVLINHWGRDAREYFEPDAVFVEQPFGRFPKATLEQMVGVTLAALAAAVECPILTLPVPQWKQLALGKGNATKAEVMDWARDRGYVGRVQDEADALGVAVAGLEVWDRETGREAA